MPGTSIGLRVVLVAITVVALLAPIRLPAAEIPIPGPAPFSVHVGARPRAVRAVDFDLDGRIDLAVANTGAETVSILLYQGQGRFTSTDEIQTGPAPIALRVADFNGDEVPDLVVVTETAGLVAVFVGDGHGNFARTVEHTVGGAPRSVEVADLDANGTPDVAVPSPGNDAVFLLYGDGAGGFSSMATVEVTGGPSDLAVSDFDGNGRIDLVLTRDRQHAELVTLLQDDGSGYRQVAGPSAESPRSIVSGDLDGDGLSDVVVQSGPEAILAFLGNGDGSFAAPEGQAESMPIPPVSTPFLTDGAAEGTGSLAPSPAVERRHTTLFSTETSAAPSTTSLGIHDFDLDGHLDVVVAGTQFVAIHRGDGAGGFSEAGQLSVGVLPRSVEVVDFNGDVAPDLLVANEGSDTISVLPGDGQGRFLQSRDLSFSNPSFVLATHLGSVSDVEDGTPAPSDSAVDLAVTSFLGGGVSVLINDGTGGTGQAFDIAVGRYQSTLGAGDFDGDGDVDLVVARFADLTGLPQPGPGLVTLLLADPAVGFSVGEDHPVGTEPSSLVTVDLDQDDKLDVAVANSAGDTVSLLWGDDSGSFDTGAVNVAGASPLSIGAADFDENGIPDLVVAGSGGVWVISGNPDNPRLPDAPRPLGTPSEGGSPTFVATGDLDNDGHQDLVVAEDLTDDVAVLFGDGTGDFAEPLVFGLANRPRAVAIGDVNADSVPDLAIACELSDSLAILLGHEGRVFSRLADLDVGNSPLSLALGDLDGDGVNDLAVAGFFDGRVSLLAGGLPLRGDVNLSNRVDAFDVNEVGRRFGVASPLTEYSEDVDVNLDRVIDGKDLAYVATRFGESNRSRSPLSASAVAPSTPGPDTVTLVPRGTMEDRIRVAVSINTNLPVASASVRVSYDPEFLEFDRVEDTGYWSVYRNGALKRLPVFSRLEHRQPGQISIEAIPMSDSPASITEPGDLIDLVFRARAAGQTTVEFVASGGSTPPELRDASGSELSVDFGPELVIEVSNEEGAAARRIAVAIDRIDFGTVVVGDMSRKRLRISNLGFEDLTILDARTAGSPFTSFFDEAFTIPPHAYVDLPVVFSPTADGLFAEALTLHSDDPQNEPLVIELRGMGVVPP